jgi:hypothetical protein
MQNDIKEQAHDLNETDLKLCFEDATSKHIGGMDVTVKKIPTTIKIILLKRYDFIQSPIDSNLIIKFDLSLLI